VAEVYLPSLGAGVESADETALAESINHRRLNARQIQLTAIAGSIGA
jgi:amino acid permease